MTEFLFFGLPGGLALALVCYALTRRPLLPYAIALGVAALLFGGFALFGVMAARGPGTHPGVAYFIACGALLLFTGTAALGVAVVELFFSRAERQEGARPGALVGLLWGLPLAALLTPGYGYLEPRLDVFLYFVGVLVGATVLGILVGAQVADSWGPRCLVAAGAIGSRPWRSVWCLPWSSRVGRPQWPRPAPQTRCTDAGTR